MNLPFFYLYKMKGSVIETEPCAISVILGCSVYADPLRRRTASKFAPERRAAKLFALSALMNIVMFVFANVSSVNASLSRYRKFVIEFAESAY